MQNTAAGTLVVEVTTMGDALPVTGAKVLVTDLATGDRVELVTDDSGRAPRLRVQTPPRAASLTPQSPVLPYSRLQVDVQAEGFGPVTVRGVQVFPGVESLQPVVLTAGEGRAATVYEIPPSTLDSPMEREPEGPAEDSRIQTRVFIPSTIRVHLGRPDASARNVNVSFPDYIKNVASSEVYPTWPEDALRANIHAQVGFALNRIFTEWYTSRGYGFDITNSTAYDQSFVEGRNIYRNISELVDEIFNVYPRREGYLQPLFSSYCNGTTVTCRGLSQWGTVDLARRGFNPLEMLQYYYGDDVELVETRDIRPNIGSYPGMVLRRGSRSDAVKTVQQQLNRIARNYPAIGPALIVDGIYGPKTEDAVRRFQRIFHLSADGLVGRATWYRLSYLYAAVTGLSENGGEGVLAPCGDLAIVRFPGYLIRRGQRGENVSTMQGYLRCISRLYGQIPIIEADGIFGSRTEQAVRAFQRAFGLRQDGIVGSETWNELIRVYESSR